MQICIVSTPFKFYWNAEVTYSLYEQNVTFDLITWLPTVCSENTSMRNPYRLTNREKKISKKKTNNVMQCIVSAPFKSYWNVEAI